MRALREQVRDLFRNVRVAGRVGAGVRWRWSQLRRLLVQLRHLGREARAGRGAASGILTMDTGRGVQYEGEGRQVERTGTSVPARASAAVVSKLPEREGVASIFSIHGSSKRVGLLRWT